MGILLTCFLPGSLYANSSIAECAGPEVPFQVQFSPKDAPNTKEFLVKTIRKLVISGQRSIGKSSPDLSLQQIMGIMAKEYGCDVSVKLTDEEAEKLIDNLREVYRETVSRGEITKITDSSPSSFLDNLSRRGSSDHPCVRVISELASLVKTTHGKTEVRSPTGKLLYKAK